MGRACGMYGKESNSCRTFWENEMHRDHFEDLGVEVMIILQSILKNNKDLTQDGDNWLLVP
jgi:hypothetical protein